MIKTFIINKKTVLFCHLFLVYINANIFCQTSIKGKLYSSNNDIPKGVCITIGDKNIKNNIIGYCFSDDKGNFAITFSIKTDSIYINTKSLTYKDTTIYTQNTSQLINIKLTPHFNHIKEVNVKGYPITSKEDTTTYFVSSFEKDNDESIEDVIKHMPGFTVKSNGEILFNGAKIEKYYINGMDLLGQKYPIANKNLSNKQVSSVQVLHNHQPIKMLKKIIHSEKTSINIKLKNKYTITYRIKGGMGIPWQKHSLNFSPMIFAPNNQMISTIQSNNIGNELLSQHRPILITNNYINSIDNEKTELLNLSHISPTAITNKSRYLDNNSNLISFNYLKKINNNKQLKTNISFYNDYSTEKATTNTTYYLNNDTIKLYEIQKNKYYNNSIISDLTFTNNADNNYINNTLRIENYWDHSVGEINNKETNIKSNNPFLSTSDELDIYKIIGKHFFNFKFFIDYNHAPNYIKYTPGVLTNIFNNNINYSRTQQNFNKNNFQTFINTSFSIIEKKWRFKTLLGINYYYDFLTSNIYINNEKNESDSLLNNINWNRINSTISEKITYKKDKDFKIQLTIPAEHRNYSLSYKQNYITPPHSELRFNPELYIYWNTKQRITLTSNVFYKTAPDKIEQQTPGYIITDYLSISKNQDILSTNKNTGTFFDVKFNNPTYGLLSNIKYQYLHTKKNIILKKNSLGNGVFRSESIQKNNSNYSHYIQGEITYFIANWNTTLNITTNYSRNKNHYIIDGSLKNSHLFNTNYSFDFLFNYWSKINLKYHINYNNLSQKNNQISYTYTTVNQSLNCFIFFSKKHSISTSFEQYINNNKTSRFYTYFGDMEYNFNLTNSKFKFKFSNIFNNERITYYNINDISLIKNQYTIRPSEFMLFLTYKF